MSTGRFAHLKRGDTVLYQEPHPRRRSELRDLTVYSVGRKWIYASSDGTGMGYPAIRFTFDGKVDSQSNYRGSLWLSRDERDREMTERALIDQTRRRLSRSGRGAFDVIKMSVEAAADIAEVLDRHGINMPDTATKEG